METILDYLALLLFIPICFFCFMRMLSAGMTFLNAIVTAVIATSIIFLVIIKGMALIADHWFISAIIVGVITFIFTGQKIEMAITAIILSAFIFLILGLFTGNSDRNDSESKRQEYQEYQERERQERARQEREYQERERQERERQEKERQERERQERERQERERQERERQERERQERERQERERQEREQSKSNEYTKIFNNYYQAISEHRFFEAYSLLSDREQKHQGSLEDFAEGRKDVLSIDVLNFKISDEKETKIVAEYRIRTKDKDGNGVLVNTFDGNVTLIKSAGTWKIDALSSKKIESHRE